jgi:hypothetical protein
LNTQPRFINPSWYQFIFDSLDIPGGGGTDGEVLEYKNTSPGQEIASGTELRILTVGDSITVGFLSDQDGGDGNGYRLELLNDLSSKYE